LVADQIAAAGALVSLETNVQPESVLPSNKSIRLVGEMAESFCARAGTPRANKKMRTDANDGFINTTYKI